MWLRATPQRHRWKASTRESAPFMVSDRVSRPRRRVGRIYLRGLSRSPSRGYPRPSYPCPPVASVPVAAMRGSEAEPDAQLNDAVGVGPYAGHAAEVRVRLLSGVVVEHGAGVDVLIL